MLTRMAKSKLTVTEQKMIASLREGEFVYIERHGQFYYAERE